MRGQSNVDETRFGVFGKSLGGLEALIFAMRNANVLAVIGLDATYGFKGNQKLLTDLADYSPRKMRAAFLDLRRDWDDPEKVLDLSAEHSLHYSDRTFITVKRMHHRDFDSDAMIGFTFHLPIGPNEMDSYQSGWTRETGYRGHQNVCQIVLDYFDEKVKGDPRGAERLITDIARADGAVLKQEDALVPPPSAVEFSRLITRQGFDAATAIVDRYRRQIPDDPVIEADVFNDYGYRLIAEHRLTEAIEMLRLIVYAYPDSAAAADGLADAYIAAKQNDLARAALHQALKLIPADPRLNEANKQWLAQGEQAKLDQLRP
jgi:hypothetical protein